ncbi:MAG: hypothetical protein ACP5OC_05985 [Thermoplasmata archaeon]
MQLLVFFYLERIIGLEIMMVAMEHRQLAFVVVHSLPEITGSFAMHLHMFFNMCGVRSFKTVLIAVISGNFLFLIIFSSENGHQE